MTTTYLNSLQYWSTIRIRGYRDFLEQWLDDPNRKYNQRYYVDMDPQDEIKATRIELSEVNAHIARHMKYFHPMMNLSWTKKRF